MKSNIQELPKLFLILILFPLIIYYLVRHNAIDNSPMRSKRKSKIKSGVSESNSCEKSYDNISSGGILINNGHSSSQFSISNNNVLSSNSGSSHNNNYNNNYNNTLNSTSRSPRNPASNTRNCSQNNNQNNNNNNNSNVNHEQNMRDLQNREFKDLPVGPLILPYKKTEPTFQKKVQSPRPYNNYTEPPMRERTLSRSTSDSTYCTYF